MFGLPLGLVPFQFVGKNLFCPFWQKIATSFFRSLKRKLPQSLLLKIFLLALELDRENLDRRVDPFTLKL